MGDTARAASVELGEAGWFSALVEEAVARADAAALPIPIASHPRARHDELRAMLWSSGVLLGRPFDGVEGPVLTATDLERAFVQRLRLELASAARLVAAQPVGPARRRIAVAALAAAHAGELATAVVLDEVVTADAGLAERDERRLFGIVGARLVRRAYLAGNPPGGLPLHALLGALELRALTRLASAHLGRGGPLRRRAARIGARLSAAKALAIELFASALLGAAPGADALKVIQRQVRAAALATPDRRQLLRHLAAPRDCGALVGRAPAALRVVLVEQLVLAALEQRRWTPEVVARIEAAALAAGLGARSLAALEARMAAFLLEHEHAARGLAPASDEEPLRHVLGAAMDSLHEAAGAIATEARETGELGVLLARLAQGEALDADERRRMREQLLDLAKVVPSLAILAAPGGMLLLPIVLKLLPFDLRPSSFRGPAPRPAKVEPPEAA